MKPILLIAGFYAGLNAAILGSIGLTVGFPAAHKIHVGDNERVPMMTLDEMGLSALLVSPLLSVGDRPRLIILGASGPAQAFPPRLVEAMLPDYETSNLAVPAARMTETLVEFDEVLDAVPASVLPRSVLVLGVTPMAFWPEAFPFSPVKEPRLAWWKAPRELTLITQATARSPALLDVRHPVRRMLPQSLVFAAKQRFRCWWRLGEVLPEHPGQWLAQRGSWRFNIRDMKWHLRAPVGVVEEHQSLPQIRKELEWHLAQTRRFGRPYDPRQFDAFSTLLRRATASGMRVVVVDMPLHSEHLSRPEYASPFKKRLAEVVAAFTASTSGDGQRVTNLDLTAAMDDQYFASLAHASKAGRPAWVRLLVERLRPAVGMGKGGRQRPGDAGDSAPAKARYSQRSKLI
jgi:hypothetical protein